MTRRFLVTGALGCIGAWTARELVRRGDIVVAFDAGANRRRVAALLAEDEIDRIDFVQGDITDYASVEAVVERVSDVIHLAALQVPACRADPILGARVNVVGTVNVFEAARAAGIGYVVYTSSIGMFAPTDVTSGGRLLRDASAHPSNHYGVYKLANEGTARVYSLDHGLASIGFRPLTVFGVGRDQGLTSGPTKAIVSALLGRPFRIPFGGVTLFQYAEDVAKALVLAADSKLDGARVYNLPGTPASGQDVVDAIEAAVPGGGKLISFEDQSLPFPADIDSTGIEELGDVLVTPFGEGVERSVAIFRTLAERNDLRAEDHGLEPAG